MYKTRHARTMPASRARAGQGSENTSPSPCPGLTHDLNPRGPQTRRVPY